MCILPEHSQSLQHGDRPLQSQIVSRTNWLAKEGEAKEAAKKAYEIKLAETGVDPENEEQMLTFLADSDNAKLKEDAETSEELNCFLETGVFQVSELTCCAHAITMLRDDADAEYLKTQYAKLIEHL